MSRSPTARPRPSRGTWNGGPAAALTSVSRPFAPPSMSCAGIGVGDLRPFVGDVTVGGQEVEPAVVVGVEEGDAEAQAVSAGRVQADRGRAVGEEARAEVLVERGRLAEEVGDGQVEPTVAVEVAAGDPHPCAITAAAGRRQAGLVAGFLEAQAAPIAEQEVGRPVVGDEQVDLAVLVEVGGDHAQAPAVAVDDPGFTRHVDEPAAIVAEEVIRAARRSVAGRRD